jgi:hypothetical protein
MSKTTAKQIWLRLPLSITLIAIATIAHIKPAEAVSQAMKDRASKKLKSADKNEDGGLSVDEAKAGGMPKKILQNFDVIDTNKDGLVTETELFSAFDNGIIKR